MDWGWESGVHVVKMWVKHDKLHSQVATCVFSMYFDSSQHRKL